jgi:hypothetical protein
LQKKDKLKRFRSNFETAFVFVSMFVAGIGILEALMLLTGFHPLIGIPTDMVIAAGAIAGVRTWLEQKE